MKRVLIITYYWPPSGGAGVQRWLKFSKFLPESGWQPVVITVDPAHATYPVMDATLEKEVGKQTEVIRTPSSEWYSFYQKISKVDKIPHAGFANEGNTISFKQKASRFFRGNFFLPDPRKGWNRHALKAAGKLLSESKVDAIITTGPPHSTHLIGLRLSKKYQVPWFADLRDPWTDIYYYRMFYPTFPAHLINLYLERRVLRNCSGIITVSEGFKNIFIGKRGIDSRKISVIPNGYDETDFENIPKPMGNTFIITYVGTLTQQYPIDSFIEAFKELLDEHQNLRLRFIGSVSDSQQLKLKIIPKDHLEFVHYLDHKRAVEQMGSSHLLLLVIPNHASGQGILPGKIFEYLATGNPILGLGPTEGDSASILKQSGAGIMLEFNDKGGISEAIESYYSKFMSENMIISNSEYIQQFSRSFLTGKLVSILNHQLNLR